MIEPNFSESQLQQAVNTAYTRFVFQNLGEWPFAVVPSLHAEFDLGWDSGFFFHWIDAPPVPATRGCNFFLQYKLSDRLLTNGAGQWHAWHQSYLRFKIPHASRNAQEGNFDDYHQWERLKSLANRHYPTYYATNSLLDLGDLQFHFQNESLLESTPLLDVRLVHSRHRYVTFTENSPHFCLHSKLEEAPKSSFSATLKALGTDPQSMNEANEKLIKAFHEIGNELQIDDGFWFQDLDILSTTRRSGRRHYVIQQLRIANFVLKHFGLQMYWLPVR